MVNDIRLHGMVVHAPSGTGLVICCRAIVLRLCLHFISLDEWEELRNQSIFILFCFVGFFPVRFRRGFNHIGELTVINTGSSPL